MLATAKSCTGGLIAAACTEVSGSSDWFERGFLTCSNAAKTELLGVPAALIYKVSEPVARAMAAGALLHSRARLTVDGSTGGGGLSRQAGRHLAGLGDTQGPQCRAPPISGTRSCVPSDSGTGRGGSAGAFTPVG